MWQVRFKWHKNPPPGKVFICCRKSEIAWQLLLRFEVKWIIPKINQFCHFEKFQMHFSDCNIINYCEVFMYRLLESWSHTYIPFPPEHDIAFFALFFTVFEHLYRCVPSRNKINPILWLSCMHLKTDYVLFCAGIVGYVYRLHSQIFSLDISSICWTTTFQLLSKQKIPHALLLFH